MQPVPGAKSVLGRNSVFIVSSYKLVLLWLDRIIELTYKKNRISQSLGETGFLIVCVYRWLPS